MGSRARSAADLADFVRAVAGWRTEAILLAHQIGADLLLVDEKAARDVASTMGLNPAGVLAVLSEGTAMGLVDIADAVKRLKQTNFRCSAALLKGVLDRAPR